MKTIEGANEPDAITAERSTSTTADSEGSKTMGGGIKPDFQPRKARSHTEKMTFDDWAVASSNLITPSEF
jgi:hypothetical protein